MTDDDFRVYLINLPGTVHGAVRLDAEGFPSIFINDRLSPAAKKAAYLHELQHIHNDDFYNSKPIKKIESK